MLEITYDFLTKSFQLSSSIRLNLEKKKLSAFYYDRGPLMKTIIPYLLGLNDVSLSKVYYTKFACLIY